MTALYCINSATSKTNKALLIDTFIQPKNVGYQTQDQSGKNWVSVSFGFESVGGAGYYTMKDISTKNFSDASDTLQVLEPTMARTVKKYFVSEGVWYENQDEWYVADEDTFDSGTGFLANLASGSVELTVAGQVPSGPTQLDLSGKIWVMVGNPIPRAVKFKEIEAINFSDASDTLQVLEPTMARTVKKYFNSEGDWYENQDEWYDANEDEIGVGEALLGNVASGSVKLNFPSAF